MKLSYRVRLTLIALLLVLSTLFASCDILVSMVPPTETQDTTTTETTPEDLTAENSSPEVTTPDESTPEGSTPEEVTTPEETTPEETTPEETTPEETTPEETTPEETTPEETTPEETTPEVTTPEETTPAEPEVDEPVADSTLTIAEVIALGSSKEHNTYTEGKYYVTGVITEVYNTQYGNMKITDGEGNILTIYGTYSTDGSTRYDQLAVKPVAGDTVTIYGIVGQFNGTPQIKNGWIISPETAPEETNPEETTPEGTTPEVPATLAEQIAEANKLANGAYLSYESTMTGTVTGAIQESSYTAGTYKLTLTDGTNTVLLYFVPFTGTPVEGCTVTVTGKLTAYNGSAQFDKTATATVEGASVPEETTPEETTPSTPAEPSEPAPAEGTVVGVIKDIAAANSWSDGNSGGRYDSFNLNEYISVSVTATATGSYGVNSGKPYGSPIDNWRIYQNESPAIKIEAAAGKTIVSVKVTYDVSKTGILTLNGANVESATLVEVNANSITFGVGNTGTATNGQVRITAIEVVYA